MRRAPGGPGLRYHRGMWVECPECGAGLEGTSGAENVCPACMTPFLVPASARAVRTFDVQPAGGEPMLHGLSRYAIRESIYLGRLTASARVRPMGRGGRGQPATAVGASAAWELIGGYPEFASVFRLLGGDLAPMAGTRKLAGWKQSSPADDHSDVHLVRDIQGVNVDAEDTADAIPTLEESTPTTPHMPPKMPPAAAPPPPAPSVAVSVGDTAGASRVAYYLLVGGLILAALSAAGLLLR